MSLTAFQRYRRMHQVEEMKPENIIKNQGQNSVIESVEEKVTENITNEPSEESEEETNVSLRRRNNRRLSK